MLGSQAPDERIARVLSRHAATAGRELVAIVDADPAGRAWGQRLSGLLDNLGTDLMVIEPPDGLDLNAWARHDGPEWESAICAGIHVPRIPSDALSATE